MSNREQGGADLFDGVVHRYPSGTCVHTFNVVSPLACSINYVTNLPGTRWRFVL